jgi:hypothetical protein
VSSVTGYRPLECRPSSCTLQVDFVLAITSALNRSGGKGPSTLNHPPSAFVTTLIVPEGTSIEVDEEALAGIGVQRIVFVPSHKDMQGHCYFDAEKLVVQLHQLLVPELCAASDCVEPGMF